MTLQEAVRRRIDMLLAKNKMTKYALAKKMAVNYSTLNNLYRNERNGVSFNTIALLAQAFEMTLIEFLDDPVFDLDYIDLY